MEKNPQALTLDWKNRLNKKLFSRRNKTYWINK